MDELKSDPVMILANPTSQILAQSFEMSTLADFRSLQAANKGMSFSIAEHEFVDGNKTIQADKIF